MDRSSFVVVLSTTSWCSEESRPVNDPHGRSESEARNAGVSVGEVQADVRRCCTDVIHLRLQGERVASSRWVYPYSIRAYYMRKTPQGRRVRHEGLSCPTRQARVESGW